MGPFVGFTTKRPDFFEYFLNPKNHKSGIPIDFLAYHFYAVPRFEETLHEWQYTVFEQADKFLDVVLYIESIRKRLAPETRTLVNELGIVLPDNLLGIIRPGFAQRTIPEAYRNLYAAYYAYTCAELARLGVDVVAQTQLVAGEGWSSGRMLDGDNGEPNATYWALKLWIDNFGPGDKLVNVSVDMQDRGGVLPSPLYALGFLKPDRRRKILVVNRYDRPVDISLVDAVGARVEVVDQMTGTRPPATSTLNQDRFRLGGLGVGVLTLPK